MNYTQVNDTPCKIYVQTSITSLHQLSHPCNAHSPKKRSFKATRVKFVISAGFNGKDFSQSVSLYRVEFHLYVPKYQRQ